MASNDRRAGGWRIALPALSAGAALGGFVAGWVIRNRQVLAEWDTVAPPSGTVTPAGERAARDAGLVPVAEESILTRWPAAPYTGGGLYIEDDDLVLEPVGVLVGVAYAHEVYPGEGYGSVDLDLGD